MEKKNKSGARKTRLESVIGREARDDGINERLTQDWEEMDGVKNYVRGIAEQVCCERQEGKKHDMSRFISVFLGTVKPTA